jgi:undecaprenyl-diphosphatase
MNKLSLYFARVKAIDSALCIKVNKTSHNLAIRVLFRTISRLGDGVFWYTIMLAILLANGSNGYLPVAHMIIVGLVGTMLYNWLKGKTLRPRPYEVHQDIWLTGRPLDRFSFPSGHTLHAVAFSVVAIFYYPALAIFVVPFASMVALSRVVLGLHYPSDVLMGALIGFSISTGSITLLQYANIH